MRWLVFIIALLFAHGAIAQERPNILWITCEDLSPQLGCYGDTTVPTPNIDHLSANGIRYTHAFATTPVCAPARSALITGMYPTVIGSMHMRTGNPSKASLANNAQAYNEIPSYEAVPPPHVRCFPEFLRSAGYYCTNNSKTDYQFKAPLTTWDESSRKAHWRNRGDGQPFFSVFNFTVTHESGTFGKGRSPRKTDRDTIKVPPYYPDIPIVCETLGRHYDNIVALDEKVGALLKDLEDDGLSDSTIIFFYSDHGTGLIRSKRWVYDSGIHVPLIVSFPDGTGRGTTRNDLVSFIDFGPTVLSLAGVELPEGLNGRAFLGDQSAPQSRDYIFAHRDRMDAEYDTIRAVRDHRYKYIRNFRPELPYVGNIAYRDRAPMMPALLEMIQRGTLGPDQWQLASKAKPIEELYDTITDPHEIHNLASDPAHLPRLAEMRTVLETWIEETGDLGLIMPESEMVHEHLWHSDTQPTTAAPTVIANVIDNGELDDGNNSVRIVAECVTPGAVIMWRERSAKDRWQRFLQPIKAGIGEIEFRAHRIGFLQSEIVRVTVENRSGSIEIIQH